MGKASNWVRVAALLATAALVGAACGDDDDTTAPPGNGGADEVCTAERAGGTVTVGTYSEATGLDPAAGSGLGTGKVGATEGSAIYDVLMIYDSETGEYRPHLAESFTANDDNTVWTLRLRPGITFDNGDPLDAEAVRTSIRRHTAEGSRATLRRGLVSVR
jgi:peptide/nickel transport system substrate-binding protein